MKMAKADETPLVSEFTKLLHGLSDQVYQLQAVKPDIAKLRKIARKNITDANRLFKQLKATHLK